MLFRTINVLIFWFCRHLVARKLGDDDEAFILEESVRESKLRSQH